MMSHNHSEKYGKVNSQVPSVLALGAVKLCRKIPQQLLWWPVAEGCKWFQKNIFSKQGLKWLVAQDCRNLIQNNTSAAPVKTGSPGMLGLLRKLPQLLLQGR